MKICPECKTDNPSEALFCRKCGIKIVDSPEITGFYVEPVCRIGDKVRVTWNIENADSVMLNGIDVTNKNQSTIIVTNNIELKLTAKKGSIETSRIMRINPMPSRHLSNRDLNDKECKHEDKKNYWIFLYALITLLCTFLLFMYINNTDVVHHYVHTSYNNWKWIEKLLLVVLIISCSIPTILLIKTAWKKSKN